MLFALAACSSEAPPPPDPAAIRAARQAELPKVREQIKEFVAAGRIDEAAERLRVYGSVFDADEAGALKLDIETRRLRAAIAKEKSPIAREGLYGQLQALHPTDAKVAAEAKRALAEGKQFRAKQAQQEKDAKRAELAARRKAGVSIGMTQTEVLQSSWGRPERINTSSYSWGTREQWVYGGRNYLYFRNGVLESVQTSR